MKAARLLGMVIPILALLFSGTILGSSSHAAGSRQVARSGTDATKVTLTVWDNETGAPGKLEDKLYAQFHQKYPNVTINRVAYAFNDLAAKLQLAMSGPNPPDVTELAAAGKNGPTLVKAGLIVNLNSYARKYGWTKRFASSFLAWAKYTSSGQHGYGNLYGVPQSGEIVGVYYNKGLLRQFKLGVPKTFGQFQKDLATVKVQGKTPILLGDLEKWPAIHDYESINLQTAGAAYYRHFTYADKHVTFTTSQNLQAATTFQSWAKKGYFEDGFLGVTSNNYVPMFSSGNFAFLITGSWVDADLEKAMGTNVGFFLVPPLSQKGHYAGLGATSEPFAISSKSKHKDVAAQLIDFLTSKSSELQILQLGGLPLMGGLAKHLNSNTAQAGLVRAWGTLSKDNGLGPYMDSATPSMGDTLGAALQELAGGQITPQQFVSQVQDDYTKYHS